MKFYSTFSLLYRYYFTYYYSKLQEGIYEVSLPIRPPEPGESEDSYTFPSASPKRIARDNDHLNIESHEDEELPDFFNSELPDFGSTKESSKNHYNQDETPENILETSGDYDEEELDRELGLLDDFDNPSFEANGLEEAEDSQEFNDRPIKENVSSIEEMTFKDEDSQVEDTINSEEEHNSYIPSDELPSLPMDRVLDSDSSIFSNKPDFTLIEGVEEDEIISDESSTDLTESEDNEATDSVDSEDDDEDLDLNALIESLNEDNDNNSEEQNPIDSSQNDGNKAEVSEDNKDEVIFSESDDDEDEEIDFDFLDSLIEDTDDDDPDELSISESNESSNSQKSLSVDDEEEEFSLNEYQDEEEEDFSLELQEALGENYNSQESIGKSETTEESNSIEDIENEEAEWSSLLDDIGISMDESNDSESSESEEGYSEEDPENEQLPDFNFTQDDTSKETYESEPSALGGFTNSENSEDEDEDDEDDFSYDEEEFTPPENPFASPLDRNFDNEEDDNADGSSDSSSDFDTKKEDSGRFEDPEDSDDSGRAKKESVLLNKLSSLFDSAALKLFLTNYLDSVKAEMQGKDAPPPKTKIEEEVEEEEDLTEEEELDSDDVKPRKKKPRKKKRGKRLPNIFGFLTPIKKLYLFVVNLFFKVLTTILGILSKLPIIGRFVSPILGMTRLLQQLANYLPIVVLIGAMILASFLSIPREHMIELPDSGSATFNSFKYDSKKQVAKGTITNTGEVIATVEPEFTVMTLQPELMKPKTWVVPQEVFKCNGDYTSVDIESEEKIEVKCSSKKDIPGYFPRVVGEISE